MARRNGCHLLSELRSRVQNSLRNRFVLKTCCHCLLSFTSVTFLIHCPLSLTVSCGYWCWPCFVGLTYEIYDTCCVYAYVYFVVYYLEITATYVKSDGSIFVHLYNLVDDMECSWTMCCTYYPSCFHTWKKGLPLDN